MLTNSITVASAVKEPSWLTSDTRVQVTKSTPMLSGQAPVVVLPARDLGLSVDLVAAKGTYDPVRTLQITKIRSRSAAILDLKQSPARLQELQTSRGLLALPALPSVLATPGCFAQACPSSETAVWLVRT